MGKSETQQGNSSGREQDSQGTSQQTKHQRLSEKLRKKSNAVRAERLTHRNFTPLRCGSYHQKIGDIGTRNQQYQHDRTQKADNGWPQRPHELFAQRLEKHSPVAVRRRIFGSEPHSNHLHVGVGTCQTDAWT